MVERREGQDHPVIEREHNHPKVERIDTKEMGKTVMDGGHRLAHYPMVVADGHSK
jgi:hypothetical protein